MHVRHHPVDAGRARARASTRSRYVGDAVAAVAAVDERHRRRGARADRGRVRGAARRAHDPTRRCARPEPQVHEKRARRATSRSTSTSSSATSTRRSPSADVVVEDDYCYAGLDPRADRAALRDRASSTPTACSRCGRRRRCRTTCTASSRACSSCPPQRIRVIQPAVGGAFGGKSEPFALEFCVAKLAMITGRPVKILYTREEVFYAHRGRHPMRMHYRTGVDEGRHAHRRSTRRSCIDGGAYSSFGLVTTYYSGQLLTAPYRFPTYRFDSTRVFTNKPPLRAQARARLGAAALRVRVPARQARREARHRSDRDPPHATSSARTRAR